MTGRFEQHKRLTGQLVGGKLVSWPAKRGLKQEEGQLALVTVTAASREDKPLQAVAGIELVGRYVTLRWQGSEKATVHISRKLSASERIDYNQEKILAACHKAGLLEFGFTLIFRRASFMMDGTISGASCEAAIAEAVQMVNHWQKEADMPKDLQLETKTRSVYGGFPLAYKFSHYCEELPAGLITCEDWQAISEQVSKASQSEIITKDGAVLHIEQTRAAFMIDIDSATSKLAPGPLCVSVLSDLFGAMRFRRLAGKILVDMPRLTKDQRSNILKLVDERARLDLRFPDCIGFTRSGILEFSVRHGRPIIHEDDEVKAVIKANLR